MNPTASSTAALAMGDALAITLFKKRGFTEEDFAALHPGGALGRRLLRVRDLMHMGEDMPLVREDEAIEKVLLEMSLKKLGHTGVVDSDGRLAGVISDGDLRRSLAKDGALSDRWKAPVIRTSGLGEGGVPLYVPRPTTGPTV